MLVGQEHAESALARALAQDRVSHAYLFVGPESVGKHTAALLLAQALNCQQGQRLDTKGTEGRRGHEEGGEGRQGRAISVASERDGPSNSFPSVPPPSLRA